MHTNEAKKSIADNCDNSYCEEPGLMNIPSYRYYLIVDLNVLTVNQATTVHQTQWQLMNSFLLNDVTLCCLLKAVSFSLIQTTPGFLRVQPTSPQGQKDRICVRMITLHSLAKIRSFPPCFQRQQKRLL